MTALIQKAVAHHVDVIPPVCRLRYQGFTPAICKRHLATEKKMRGRQLCHDTTFLILQPPLQRHVLARLPKPADHAKNFSRIVDLLYCKQHVVDLAKGPMPGPLLRRTETGAVGWPGWASIPHIRKREREEAKMTAFPAGHSLQGNGVGRNCGGERKGRVGQGREEGAKAGDTRGKCRDTRG